MIDMEREIFAEVEKQVREKYPKVFMTGEIVSAPPSFPCVSLEEVDNAGFRNSMTQEDEENHAAVTYELNVYSNKKTGKKAECREIAGLIDGILSCLNFTRMMLKPVPNRDATIYRILGRYRAVISKNGTIYRR